MLPSDFDFFFFCAGTKAGARLEPVLLDDIANVGLDDPAD